MTPLAHTLALLAMTVATVASEVKPLDMAPDSFDDQYQDCGPQMMAALPALNRSEFQKNSVFAKTWPKAVAKWQSRGSPLSPLSSPAQAIAIVAYTMNDLYQDFNNAVRVAGSSPQQYRDNFHYKTLHFLLTQALVTLRNAQGTKHCHTFRGVSDIQFEAKPGDTVRFGRFASTSRKKSVIFNFGADTTFEVYTCHGADIQRFSAYPVEEEVLIPPFETFKVTKFTQKWNRAEIELRSTGTYSKYNCEWLKGGSNPSITFSSTSGSVPSAPFHLGGFLLATTALAVSTRIL